MKFEYTSVMNFQNALRGMRNAHDSWDKIDSYVNEKGEFILGENDKKLAISLIKAGSEHRKFLRQIFVSVDISAPLYWWKEFSTYKVATTSNSCSTMHTLMKKEFTPDMFECKNLNGYREDEININKTNSNIDDNEFESFLYTLSKLNKLRSEFLETKDKDIWKSIIVMLPTSFIQKRTITMNYENLFGMCSKGQRRFHKLTEWSKDFIDWARTLPYAQEFIFVDELSNNE